MKLAEALSIRADLQKKVAQLKERIKESAKVQEGDEPCDNVEEMRQLLMKANDINSRGFLHFPIGRLRIPLVILKKYQNFSTKEQILM